MAKKISSLSVVLGATTAPFEKAFRGAGNAVSSLQSKLASAGKSILKFTGIAAGLSAIFGVLKGATAGVRLAAEMEQLGVAFEVMLGSADRATQMIDGLKEVWQDSIFDFNIIVGSAKTLMSFGHAAESVNDKLVMLSDVATATNKPLEDITKLYGQMSVEGKISGERLNQMLERGVPIIRELSKVLGVAESDIRQMTSKGQIQFSHVEKALQNLTNEGGQFAGMTEKMSKTLAVRWSWLMESIQMATAGVFTAVAEAFNFSGIIAFVATATDSIGSYLADLATRVIPLVVTGLQWLWGSITSVFNAIWGFLQPIVSAIGDFIVRNWQTALASTIGYVMGVWNVVKSVFTAVWEIVSTIGSGLVSAWTWAMGMLGFSTEETGVSVSGAFQSIFDAAAWLQDKVTIAFHTMAYVIRNWRDALDLAVINAALGIVRFANQVVHVIGTVIPDFLMWLSRNWRQVFTDILNGTALILVHLYDNITGFFKSVWSWLKGDGFDWQWTGLTEGFESTLEELPRIAERKIGPLEKSLANQADILGKRFSQGLGEYLAEQETAAESATKGIANAVAGIGSQLQAPQMEAIAAPDSPAQVMTDQIEGIGAAAKATSDQLQALFSGSAESQRARFAARFNAGQGSTAASAAPVPASATRAMRENAGQENVMKQLLELIRTGTNRTLEDIRDGVRDGGLAVAGDI